MAIDTTEPDPFDAIVDAPFDAALSERLRAGLVVVDHGWGSRIFDPRGGTEPQSFGVNRNLLVGDDIDPLSQTSTLSSTYVAIEPVAR